MFAVPSVWSFLCDTHLTRDSQKRKCQSLLLQRLNPIWCLKDRTVENQTNTIPLRDYSGILSGRCRKRIWQEWQERVLLFLC